MDFTMEAPDPDRLLLVGDLPGFTPEIGRLVSMMNYARHTTLHSVQGLTLAQLDFRFDGESNSIGALLHHMAAVEFAYQIATFEERFPTEQELEPWDAALNLGDLGWEELRGRPLEFYLNLLHHVRAHTLAEFRRRDDAWLARERPFWSGRPSNNHFMWFHVFEDEINHRGQIRWLRKRLPG